MNAKKLGRTREVSHGMRLGAAQVAGFRVANQLLVLFHVVRVAVTMSVSLAALFAHEEVSPLFSQITFCVDTVLK